MAIDPQQVQHERAKEQQATGAAQQVAAQQGAQSLSFDDLQEHPDLVDTLFSPGIDRDEENLPDGVADDLEDFLAAEFGTHVGLGNISREEYERERTLDVSRALLALQGYPRQGRSGSECSGEVREIMVGDDAAEKPTLTDDRARQIRAAFAERSMLRSLSVNARGYRGLTEFIGHVRSEGFDSGDSDGGGRLSSITSRLP